MKDTIKINGKQINMKIFRIWFEETLAALGIDDKEIIPEQTKEIAEKFFNNLNEETTS
jgi:hypothetical protein